MKNLFYAFLLTALSVTLVGCSGAPSDETPVKAQNTGAPAVEKKGPSGKNKSSNDRGEAALESKIRRGSKGGGGGK